MTPEDLSPLDELDPILRRKRRKVATRSCQLCRQRKQRCELPDTEIEDSTTPLGPEKACHRCKVLQVDCVVDDRGTLKYAPARRQRRKQVNGSASTHGLSASPSNTGTPLAGPSTSAEDAIDEGDIMTTFEPYSRGSHTRTVPVVARIDRSENGLKYHGRPQTITTVMMQMASRRSKNIEPILSAAVVQSLEAHYPSLLTFHPYLPDWNDVISCNDLPGRLRRNLILYLLHPSAPPIGLASEIYRLRDQVMRTFPRSHATFHAFLLLLHAAPLGILPHDEIGDVNDLQRQSGLIDVCEKLVDLKDTDGRDLFDSPDTWEELQYRCSKLGESLEEDPPGTLGYCDWHKKLFDKPDLLQQAQESPYRLIGKLEILERAIRLDIVRNAVAEIQADTDPGSISKWLSYYIKELEQVDDRLSTIIASLNIDMSGPAETWMSYRNVCYQYQLGKIYRTAIRALISTAYPDACDPANVHLFFTAEPPPEARKHILPLLLARVNGIGPLLQSFLSLDPKSLLPWHQIICMVVDTCNVIMEIQAGTLAFGDVDKADVSRNFRLQEWAQLKAMLLRISENLQVADRGNGRTLGDVAAKLIEAMVRVMEGRVRRFAQERTLSSHVPSDTLLDHEESGTALPEASSSSSPSEFSAAELDQMFAEIFNTTYPGVEWLNMDGEV